MIAAVIPARNEARKLAKVITNLSRLPINLLLPVINGSTDTTLKEILALKLPQAKVIYFRQALGIDVARAIGARYALDQNAQAVLFIDGDMTGNFQQNLLELLEAVQNGVDLALTDCYPGFNRHQLLTYKALRFRAYLNRLLGLNYLGVASPSHGPHALSRRLITSFPLNELAIPPVALVLTKQHHLTIQVATTLAHFRLASTIKGSEHATRIEETIIGDHLEAICLAQGRPRRRVFQNKNYNGYHHERRFDLLQAVASGIRHPTVFNLG
jgi:glycosyltransferase involved in cell wall biosynthesis